MIEFLHACRGESALAAKYKLDHLTKEVSGLEDKFRMFHSIQQGKVPPSLRPSIVVSLHRSKL